MWPSLFPAGPEDQPTAGRRNMRGNCYVTSEALYHLLGGRAAGYTPMTMKHEGDTHWFLRHRSGLILDPTVSQFKERPDYTQARGSGFLTREPSKRARALMKALVWQAVPCQECGGVVALDEAGEEGFPICASCGGNMVPAKPKK